MTQTQPQHQPPAQPAPPPDIQVTGAADAEAEAAPEAEAVERPVPPTYQQIEAFGYQRFTNREQSRLDFAARLLDLAEDDGQPLLERVKFVAIFSEPESRACALLTTQGITRIDAVNYIAHGIRKGDAAA